MDVHNPKHSLVIFNLLMEQTIKTSKITDIFDIALLVLSGESLPNAYPVIDFKGIGNWCTNRINHTVPFRTAVVGIGNKHPALQMAEIIAN